MGQRSRKRRRAADEPRPTSSERAEQIRAGLEPIAAGERPAPLVIAVIVCIGLALANVIGYLAGTKIQGRHPGAGVLTFSVVLGMAAYGMWRMRYWAVLGFQALLALIVLAFALLLTRASNALGVVVALAVVGLGGWLFWKLVRVMSRIQLPSRERPS